MANINIERHLKEGSGLKKFRMGLGGLCFVVAATFVMIHLGFMKDDISLTGRPKPFLTRENLWLVNASLGIVGGVLCGYKRFLFAVITGLVASLAITQATLLYLSYRDSIFMAEIIIPLLAGLIGVFLYQYLNEKFPKNKQE
jgi:hypothetical protein